MKIRLTVLPVTMLFLIFFISYSLGQQPVPLPDASQEASVTQKIGLTDITVSFHRPAVKEREVWGKLVPYDVVWRAGANENTKITFTDPVKIAGKEIPAGSYGLHMLPSENEWTIILNKFSEGWGSFGYREEDDYMRFKVKPSAAADHMEYLNYIFETSEPMKTTLVMHWEKLKVPIDVEVDVHAVTVSRLKENLRGLNQFFWQSHNQAATYCINSKTHLDDAEAWVEKSLQMNKNFTNLMTKARLVDLKGNKKESEEIMSEAFKLSTEGELNNYGYLLLQNKEVDKAISVFRMNVERYPDSWNVYDSLAEGYQNKGENKLAVEYYKKALDKVQDETQKKRISETLKTIASN